MRMVFACKGHNPSSVRWALGYLSDALSRAGHDVPVVDFDRGGTEKDIEGADAVMVYRCVDASMLERVMAWRKRGVFVLYFLDDYIFQMNCKYGGTVKDWMAPVPYMQEADCLVSSSEYLLSKMPNKPKILRRTVLGPEGMEFAKQDYRRNKGVFSVGLTAGKGRKNWTDGMVVEFLAVLERRLLPGENVVFHYFGEQRFTCSGQVSSIAHEYVPSDDWKGWISVLKGMDLGIVLNPLEENDEWCHCKSELKFVESGAMGVPLVTSRVRPFVQLVVDRVNGFLASTPSEFADKTLVLMRDELLSRKMSATVRSQVDTYYDADRNAAAFWKDVGDTMGRRR